MRGGLLLVLVLAVSVFGVLWTVWYLCGHLTGRAGHLQGDRQSAYRWQLAGYKAERAGDLQAAADAYGESLRLDPTNEELEGRRTLLLEELARRAEGW